MLLEAELGKGFRYEAILLPWKVTWGGWLFFVCTLQTINLEIQALLRGSNFHVW